MTTLAEDGHDKILKGWTTEAEVLAEAMGD